MEEAELNTYPIGLILTEIHVNISFCNNVKNFEKSVKLDTHEKVLCSSIEQGSVLLDRNLFTLKQNFSTYKLCNKWKCQVKFA